MIENAKQHVSALNSLKTPPRLVYKVARQDLLIKSLDDASKIAQKDTTDMKISAIFTNAL
jgi:hypothetical protein